MPKVIYLTDDNQLNPDYLKQLAKEKGLSLEALIVIFPIETRDYYIENLTPSSKKKYVIQQYSEIAFKLQKAGILTLTLPIVGVYDLGHQDPIYEFSRKSLYAAMGCGYVLCMLPYWRLSADYLTLKMSHQNIKNYYQTELLKLENNPESNEDYKEAQNYKEYVSKFINYYEILRKYINNSYENNFLKNHKKIDAKVLYFLIKSEVLCCHNGLAARCIHDFIISKNPDELNRIDYKKSVMNSSDKTQERAKTEILEFEKKQKAESKKLEQPATPHSEELNEDAKKNERQFLLKFINCYAILYQHLVNETDIDFFKELIEADKEIKISLINTKYSYSQSVCYLLCRFFERYEEVYLNLIPYKKDTKVDELIKKINDYLTTEENNIKQGIENTTFLNQAKLSITEAKEKINMGRFFKEFSKNKDGLGIEQTNENAEEMKEGSFFEKNISKTEEPQIPSVREGLRRSL